MTNKNKKITVKILKKGLMLKSVAYKLESSKTLTTSLLEYLWDS